MVGIQQSSLQIFWFKLRVILQDFVLLCALGNQFKDHFDGNSHWGRSNPFAYANLLNDECRMTNAESSAMMFCIPHSALPLSSKQYTN